MGPGRADARVRGVRKLNPEILTVGLKLVWEDCRGSCPYLLGASHAARLQI